MTETRALSDSGRVALDILCQIQRSSVLSCLRACGYPPSDAEGLTQAFFEQLLLRRMHTAADPERGRFRGFPWPRRFLDVVWHDSSRTMPSIADMR